jgi:cell division septum initiation protein DivIVA
MSKTTNLLTDSIENTDNLLRTIYELLDLVEEQEKKIETLEAKLAKAEDNATSLGWEASNSRDEASLRGRDGWMTD